MLADSKDLQNALNQLLTVHDICDMFRVTAMTVYTWRKDRNLPSIEIKGGPRDNVRHSVRFHPADVAVWAKTQSLRAKPLGPRARVRLVA